MSGETKDQLTVMPIHRPQGWADDLPIEGLPFSILEKYGDRVMTNHGQTLEGLARRGGLSACEAVAILEDRPWRPMCQAEAFKQLAVHVARAPI